MAYVETSGLKFVLTNSGKEEGLTHGFVNIFKYFTIGDSATIYTLETKPNDLLDINGSHGTSTNRPIGRNNNIIK